ncbi:hypothetical protein BJY54_006315 [Streptomyces nodosus]|nr:hypothetical protein [Streptomyces nodosus]
MSTTSLAVTARDRPGLGRLALRASGEEALHRRVRAIEEAGGTGRWVEDEPGIGRLFNCCVLRLWILVDAA